MQETWVQFLGWEDPLEKEMATHSSILENPIDGGAWQATAHGVSRARHDLANYTTTTPCQAFSYVDIKGITHFLLT